MGDVEQLSLELVAELADNDGEDRVARAYIDPRTIPTRHSLLKKMALSPAHYLEACQQPQDDSLAARLGAAMKVNDRTEALRLGAAIHAMITETGKVTLYPGRRAGKSWKAFEAEAAASGFVEILNEREWNMVEGVVRAIRGHDEAMRLLFDGTLVEKRIDWEFIGKACRATPDARVPRKYIADLKTAVSSEPEKFARQARQLFYHAQADLYAEAMERTGEGRPEDSFIIAVEKTRPYPVTIFRFTTELLDLGARMNRIWIERLKNCEASNVWPEYAPPPAVIDLGLPEEMLFGGGLEVNGKQLEA